MKFCCRGVNLLMMLYCWLGQELLPVILSQFMWKWLVL